MEDVIEICSGCGKMPRPIDLMSGNFTCSRCGNKTIIQVKSDEYERIATELDQKFHSSNQKMRVEAAASHPVEMKPKKTSKPAKKTKSKPAAKKAKKK